MKYYEVEFTLIPCSQDAQDILPAIVGEAGFETFEETENGLKGYVQQSMFDAGVMDTLIEQFPLMNTRVSYEIREAEDRDWNEQWEKEGFEPILVRSTQHIAGSERTLVIHDGRHLSGVSLSDYDLSIEIDAHMAFGTGTHETTRMICSALLDEQSVNGQWPKANVLDCGCGTGILGICALKLGAKSCTAYDIDEWSVENTRHNSIINQVEERMIILHGDATLLQPDNRIDGNTTDSIVSRYDFVMANINRNILLQDMEHFVSVMVPGATLILSGFYQDDCQILISKAQSLGLTLHDTRHDGDWACLSFKL